MSKLDSIKQQFPELNVSMIDILARLDTSKTYKYLPMFCKMLREYRGAARWSDEERQDIFFTLTKRNIKYTEEEAKDWKYMLALNTVSDFIPRDLSDGSKDFIEYMERGLIDNKDVLTYTSIDQMRGAVALASLKAQSKELEKQVSKVYEDDEWLVVRPLTFEASAKYGAGTKWCTTYQSEKQYFARYWRRGILAYFINKINGNKWGMFKNIDSSYEDELSWWNVADKRVDFLEINFNEKMYGVVRKLLQSREANKYLCDEELQTKVLMECDPSELKLSLGIAEGLTTIAYPPGEHHTYVDREVPLPEPGNEIEYDAAVVRAIREERLDLRDPALEAMAENFQRAIDQHIVEAAIRNAREMPPPQHILSDIAAEIRRDQMPQNGG